MNIDFIPFEVIQGQMMDRSGQTRQLLLREIEELRKQLDVAQQRRQETDERIQAEKTGLEIQKEDLGGANGHIEVLQQSLDERLRFEELMREISSRFINLPADQIDGDIMAAQRRICELLNIDRSSLLQVSEREAGKLLLTHIHQPPENPLPLGQMDARDFFPWTAQKALEGETVVISKMTDLPPEAGRDRESYDVYGTRSTVSVPLRTGQGPVLGVLAFAVLQEERRWTESVVKEFELIAQVFSNALSRKQTDESLRKNGAKLKEQLDEIESLKQRLEQENLYLLEEVRLLSEHTGIVAQSAAMKKVLVRAEQVAPTDSTVLLLGETGTGKELLARAIHGMSTRKERPLVTVNCAAMAPTLIESELFGRERGAYTGALTRMTGRFELAHGSTLFLDEIGEIPIDLQSKLLRVLEDGRFERLGSTRSQNVDVRIIAATNRDLEKDVRDGRFRQDLFYRLNVFSVVIPPLRERPDDIPLLVWKFIREFQKRMGKEIESIPKNTIQALQSHSWPGNVRELRNLIENGMIMSKSKSLEVQVPRSDPSEATVFASLEDMERMHVTAVLEKTGWRVSGPGGAAEILGLKRSTLQTKLKKLGIRRSSRALPN